MKTEVVKYYCDRCKKESCVKPIYKFRIIKRNTNLIGELSSEEDVDLCSDCQRKLETWMKEEGADI